MWLGHAYSEGQIVFAAQQTKSHKNMVLLSMSPYGPPRQKASQATRMIQATCYGASRTLSGPGRDISKRLAQANEATRATGDVIVFSSRRARRRRFAGRQSQKQTSDDPTGRFCGYSPGICRRGRLIPLPPRPSRKGPCRRARTAACRIPARPTARREHVADRRRTVRWRRSLRARPRLPGRTVLPARRRWTEAPRRDRSTNRRQAPGTQQQQPKSIRARRSPRFRRSCLLGFSRPLVHRQETAGKRRTARNPPAALSSREREPP